MTSNRKSFEQQQQNFPVFFIGNGFSWYSMIFEDSVVYTRGYSDMGAYLSDNFSTYTWDYINDSTIHLKSIHKDIKRYIQPDDLTLIIDKSSALCQLLIPLDSIESFNRELRNEFHREIVEYRFAPDERAQELIDADSVQFYPILLKEDFQLHLSKFKTKFESFGIYNGKGF
ncbi:MAG: hypothetical protein RIF36_26020 [Imperialibacter sp.]|uniref:hypothetical protein n=1 Tax=Imperialibacter sp. TaxID=2038411 RepID=UPI0032EAD9A6